MSISLQYSFAYGSWIERDKELRSVYKSDPSLAIVRARKALSDSSMLVRETAVIILGSRPLSYEDRKRLWSEYAASYNFLKGRSLPIRKTILSLLAANPIFDEKEEFEKILKEESDTSMVKIAKLGLVRP